MNRDSQEWSPPSLGKIGGAISGGASKVGGAISSGVSSGISGASNLGNTIANGASNAGNAISNGASRVGGSISNGATNLGNTVTGGAVNLGNTISNGAVSAGNSIASGATGVGNTIANGVVSGWNSIADAEKDVENALKNAKSFLDGGLSDIGTTLTNMPSTISNKVEAVKAKAQAALNSAMDDAKKQFTEIAAQIKTVANAVYHELEKIWTLLPGTIVNFIRDIIDLFTDSCEHLDPDSLYGRARSGLGPHADWIMPCVVGRAFNAITKFLKVDKHINRLFNIVPKQTTTTEAPTTTTTTTQRPVVGQPVIAVPNQPKLPSIPKLPNLGNLGNLGRFFPNRPRFRSAPNAGKVVCALGVDTSPKRMQNEYVAFARRKKDCAFYKGIAAWFQYSGNVIIQGLAALDLTGPPGGKVKMAAAGAAAAAIGAFGGISTWTGGVAGTGSQGTTIGGSIGTTAGGLIGGLVVYKYLSASAEGVQLLFALINALFQLTAGMLGALCARAGYG